ncbi:serine/threonine protein kinase [candidate division KSB1 bacterium]|nr:MAG: serine/threonine protein kinase [candidate division KSB1 bacterium]MBC6952047.1 serine/threonine protein kinase [candidate division KSB1 bacterium]MCE7943640.1 serine/threonine protein kinase [Chlorobi bacterium CHB1]MDL1875230.1 serine/threonine protein kinase [Cytophagia bacterium CHB2]
MPWLSDNLLHRLQTVADLPDLGETKYRLLEKFASGGMGTVYLAEDTQLHRKVALKVLHTPDASGELSARMLREARVIAQLEHPSIVPVHDVGELPDGRVFYVMKFVQGRRLDQYTQAENALPDRLRIFQKVCEAVAFAHANGVIHRDLKPENIMVGAFGEVLVMDWGLAKIVAEKEEQGTDDGVQKTQNKRINSPIRNPKSEINNRETLHGTIMGTPAYMAPEQKRGDIAQIDQRSDIYALGAILKFLLTGHNNAGLAQKDFSSSTISSNASPALPGAKIPKQLAAICAQAMAEEKEQRYASAQALAGDIVRFLNGLAVTSYKENIFERILRWLKQYRFILFLIAAYILARILLTILLRP